MTLLLVQMQGTWLIFKFQQTAIRHEVKQQIKAGVPESELVILHIAKVWEEQSNSRFEREHGKEFRFDGEMYDIIRSQDIGDTNVYVCIHDVKESGLFAELEEMIEEEIKHPMNEGRRKQIEDWVSAKYRNGTMALSSFSQSSTELSWGFDQPLFSMIVSVSTPPPRV
jgi:hypothetical protein